MHRDTPSLTRDIVTSTPSLTRDILILIIPHLPYSTRVKAVTSCKYIYKHYYDEIKLEKHVSRTFQNTYCYYTDKYGR